MEDEIQDVVTCSVKWRSQDLNPHAALFCISALDLDATHSVLPPPPRARRKSPLRGIFKEVALYRRTGHKKSALLEGQG
jgi:hypothetical protein